MTPTLRRRGRDYPMEAETGVAATGKQPTFEQAKEGVRAVYAMRLRDAVVGQMKPKAKVEMLPAPTYPK